jgi:hypothetical protein
MHTLIVFEIPGGCTPHNVDPATRLSDVVESLGLRNHDITVNGRSYSFDQLADMRAGDYSQLHAAKSVKGNL